MVLQCPDYLQSGTVTDVRKSWILVTPKVALQNATIRSSIEYRSPRFKLTHPGWCLARMMLHHAPVAEILSATHCVGEMSLPGIALVCICQRGRNSSFRHDCVRLPK